MGEWWWESGRVLGLCDGRVLVCVMECGVWWCGGRVLGGVW